MALITLIDHLTEALERGKAVIGLFLDFSKAFDTVNHEILLVKLHHYGIRGVMLDWFRDYLSLTELSVSYMMMYRLNLCLLNVEFPRDQSWDLCYFWYMSMIYLMLQLICFRYFMRMTLTCLLQAKT